MDENYVVPLDALGVGERHLGQLLVGHDLLHLDGAELAAAELEAEPVGPRHDGAVGRGAGGEVELPDEAVHGQAPGVACRGRAGGLPRGGPLEPLAAAPEADPCCAAVGGALLGLVLAAVGAVGLDAAPAAVPVVVALVGGVEPVQPLQVEVRVEQVVRVAAAGVVAPGDLHLGRRELHLQSTRRRREVAERHVAAGPAVVRLARRRGVDLHARVPRRGPLPAERRGRRRRQPRRPRLGAGLLGREGRRHRQRHPQLLLVHPRLHVLLVLVHHRGRVRVADAVHARPGRGAVQALDFRDAAQRRRRNRMERGARAGAGAFKGI